MNKKLILLLPVLLAFGGFTHYQNSETEKVLQTETALAAEQESLRTQLAEAETDLQAKETLIQELTEKYAPVTEEYSTWKTRTENLQSYLGD